MCDMTHSYLNGVRQTLFQHVVRDSIMCVTWRIQMCDMTHSHVRHDSFKCVTRLIHLRDMTYSYVWHDLSICVIWLIHTCDTTPSYVWHDSFIYVIWLIHVCDMPHAYLSGVRQTLSRHMVRDSLYMRDMTYSNVWHASFIPERSAADSISTSCSWHRKAHANVTSCCMRDIMRHDSFICETWLIRTWDMTHSYVRHAAFLCETWLVHMCDMTHSYVRRDSCQRCDSCQGVYRDSFVWGTCIIQKKEWVLHFSNMNDSCDAEV